MKLDFPTLDELSALSTARNPLAVLVVAQMLTYKGTLNAMGFDIKPHDLYERIKATAQAGIDAAEAKKPTLLVMPVEAAN